MSALLDHYIVREPVLVMKNAVETGLRNFLSGMVHFFLRHECSPQLAVSDIR